MKTLLVQCPCSYGVDMPPLALAYLFSTLKQAGQEAIAVDLSIELYKKVAPWHKAHWESNNGYHWYLEDRFYKLPFLKEDVYEWCIKEILVQAPDIIGFSVQNTSACFTREIIRRIKQRDVAKKIILGGPNCYNLSGDDHNFILPYGLQEFADAVVVGEGEQTFLNVISRFNSGQSFDGCAGVAFPFGDRWVFNGPASAITNLDALPLPDFGIYDLRSYKNRNVFPIMTSRGCVMNCVFCTDTSFWSPYRHRSADNIIFEMEFVKKRYQNTAFSFNDSLVNGNQANLLRLCDLMIERKLNVSWGGNFRLSKSVSMDALRKIKESGCDYFILGIESASNRILRLMRKGFTIEDAGEFIIKCHQVGISIIANWIVGFPGETEDDFMETVQFLTKHKKLIKRNTFSALTINQFSYLSTHKEEFGVVLDGYHLGLWKSMDGNNTIELRNRRLNYLEELDRGFNKSYGVVRQT